MAMVLRRDISFAGFWKWNSFCCLESWGVVSWVVVLGGEMMSLEGIPTLGRQGILELADVILR